MVSGEAVKELQIILKEEYNKDLSLAEASSIANDLVGYFGLLHDISLREGIEKAS